MCQLSFFFFLLILTAFVIHPFFFLLKKMSKVRRASIQENHDFQLSTRTRKSISKSRRSSLAEEMIKPSTSSRRNSFAALMNSIQPIEEPTMDVHKIYKKRVNKSFHKLNCFFGEPTPVDVCICEIKKEGLKAILESKVPLCYFLYYLLDEHSSENLVNKIKRKKKESVDVLFSFSF